MKLEWEFAPTEFTNRGDGQWRPLEGSRGSGENAGERGIGWFPCGYYPACSKHGAMNCVKRHSSDGSYWRCLVEGCNIGLKWAGMYMCLEPVTWMEDA